MDVPNTRIGLPLANAFARSVYSSSVYYSKLIVNRQSYSSAVISDKIHFVNKYVDEGVGTELAQLLHGLLVNLAVGLVVKSRLDDAQNAYFVCLGRGVEHKQHHVHVRKHILALL